MTVNRTLPYGALAFFLAALAVSGAAISSAGSDAHAAVADTEPPFELAGGAPSIDALMDAFLEAVEKRDKEALNALRLTKDEYQGIIVPGRVPPGSPPRQVSPVVDKYFWETMDFKSGHYLDLLVERHGGKKLERREIRFTKTADEPQRYDWYRAWGETRQATVDSDGAEVLVSTGWIAEVGGIYKFISFQWDD